VLLGTVFLIRSAYICFIVGHVLAAFGRAEKPAPLSRMLPLFLVASGIFLCVLAEIWQPQWLRSLCSSQTDLLFPGQFAPMQQKTLGAMMVLTGLIHLESARRFLSMPWLVARSKVSFPLYLIHWPILFGPCAAFFVFLNGSFGTEWARLATIAVAIGLTFAASTLFLPVDRLALEWSRSLRKRGARSADQSPRASTLRVMAGQ
jgi:peptidoglycan/LPS O-acetylase OafA/YrhL